MRGENQASETSPWQAEYLKTWPQLSLGLRRHLARLAPKESFRMVLSDGNDEVLGAFLENPLITQAEVLLLIDRATSLPLLEQLSRMPKWFANHTIKRRLLANPYTPHAVACRILDYLPLVELQRVMADVNLSREIRVRAREGFRKAFMRLSDGETKMMLLTTEGRVLAHLMVLTAKDKRVLLELIRQANVPRFLILSLASSSLTPPEVLATIARRSTWTKDGAIRRALLANDKTPQRVKDS